MEDHKSPGFSQFPFFMSLCLIYLIYLLKEATGFLCAAANIETSVGLAAFSLCLIKDSLEEGVIEQTHYCFSVSGTL